MNAIIMMLMMGEHSLVVDSADFDGTSDYMTRGAGLTGAADSKTGILSAWIRLDGGDASILRIIGASATLGGGATTKWRSSRLNTNKFLITGDNAAGTTILELISTTSYTTAATWLHLLASWNLATAAAHLYVNDSSDLAGGSTLTNDSLDYTTADWGIGANPDGTSKMNGCMAELYFAPGQYLDFSVIANRRKFISAGGKPIHLGTTGELPTGTAPLVYQHLDDAEAVANFALNAGTGGDFSITGTLTTGSTSPSD